MREQRGLPITGNNTTNANLNVDDAPPITSSIERNQRQRQRRSRGGVVRRTARAPLKIFQKLVRIGSHKRGDRERRLIGSNRARSRRRRRGNAPLLDDSISTGENMPLISTPVRDLSTHSTSTRETYVHRSNELDLDQGIENIQARVLNTAELILRHILVLIGVYLLGAQQSIQFLTQTLVVNTGYFVGVAWGTCALIQLISWFGSVPSDSDNQERDSLHDLEEEDQELVHPEEDIDDVPKSLSRGVYGTDGVLQLQRPVNKSRTRLVGKKVFHLRRRRIIANDKTAFSEFGQDDKYNADNDSDNSEDFDNVQEVQTSVPTSNERNIKPPAQNHPELEDLYLMDLIRGERIHANDYYPVDNEFMSGKMIFMCRTSDADLKTEPDQTNGTPLNDTFSRYFRDKKRRFEIQFQVKFKKIPPSQLYFHCQLKEPIKLGMIQRAFVGATLNFVEKKNKGAFTYNVPGKEPKPEELSEGKHEHPHLTFAVEKAFDRIVRTKEGDRIPDLGAEIFEDPEALKRRQTGGEPIQYNTEDTFTFALWSAYADFTKWKIVNLPAIRPFSLKSVILDQDFSMHVFYLEGTNGDTRHLDCYQRRFLSFELNNAKYCKVSEARKKWMKKYSSQVEDVVVQEILSHPEQRRLDTFSSDDEDGDAAEDNIMSDSDAFGSEDGDSDVDHLPYDDDVETQAVEELGEGMYLKSGDSIILREATTGRNEVQSSLTNGGGYATLQMEAAATVIIEKVRPKLRRKANIEDQEVHQSSLIRNGDKLVVKLIDTLGTSYLSVHKGWWLKWVRRFPKSSGLFTIHTNDIEDIKSETSLRRSGVETQSSYLRLGGTFHLRSGVSGLEVGVRVSNSAKFGGRVLGLYRSGSYYVTELDQEAKKTVDGNNIPSKRQMMMPLKLRVDLPVPPDSVAKDDSPQKPWMVSRARPLMGLQKNIEEFRIDAPAWLETMHRSKRQVVRVYAIRMTRHNTMSLESPAAEGTSPLAEEDQSVPLMRLRTGKDLTPLLRLGLTSETKFINQADSKAYSRDERCFEDEEGNVEIRRDSYDLSGALHEELVPTKLNLSIQNDVDEMDSDFSNGDDAGSIFSDNYDSDDEEQPVEPMTPRSDGYGEARKKKKWIKNTTYGITKVAKGVKTGTIKSGSLIGKAVTHTIKGRRSYLRDKPRQTKGKAKIRDHHVAVNKALKKLQSPDKQTSTGSKLHAPKSIMAGQLKPPDQSCRTVSDILSTVSSSPSIQAKMLLSALLSPLTDLDNSFLSGGAVELGVLVDGAGKGDPIGEYIVARALWESHWREEACIIHESCIDFYSPLSSKTCFSIPFHDIQRVRRVDSDASGGPLGARPILAIETAWKCHYLVLCTDEVLTDFFNILNTSIFSHGEECFQQDEWNAHMWQGVQSSADTSGESSKWASIGSSSKKKRQRIILNSRRMSFDCEAFDYNKRDKDTSEREIGAFVQELLQKALSISLETLMSNPKNFIRFLDDACRLKELPWGEIDKNGSGAFCIAVNLYHCLLQHSLLLSKTGPPTKKNVVNFMQTHCYEIGGDVFSLAELESCVIRGNMPKPYYPKPPFVQPHRSSRGHFAYALDFLDPRIIFVLNTGIMSHPQEIPVLKPDLLEEQLCCMCGLFLNNHVKVDPSRRVVTLPKICDVYRNDFDGTAKSCVEYCIQFLNESTRSKLIEMLEKNSNLLSFRYEHSCDRFYATLKPIISNDKILV